MRRHRGLAEALRSFPLKEALDLEAVGRYARTIGPPVWHNVEGMTARASIENLLLTGIESLPTNGATPAGCMAMLSTVGEEWPTTIADVVRKVRQKGLDRLRLRLEAAVAEGALPASTDIDGLSRFYLSVFQRMGHPAVGPRYLGRVLRGFVPAPSRQVRPLAIAKLAATH